MLDDRLTALLHHLAIYCANQRFDNNRTFSVIIHCFAIPNIISNLWLDIMFGAGSRIRTCEGISRQIYSLMCLTASLSQHRVQIIHWRLPFTKGFKSAKVS